LREKDARHAHIMHLNTDFAKGTQCQNQREDCRGGYATCSWVPLEEPAGGGLAFQAHFSGLPSGVFSSSKKNKKQQQSVQVMPSLISIFRYYIFVVI
jgi:hypothetical protein